MTRSRLGPIFLVGTGQTLAGGAMTPLIPLFAASLGGTPASVGVVAASAAVLPLMLGIWMGAAVDRFGPRITSIGGALGLSTAALLLGSARSVAWLIAGNAIVGLANMMLIVSIQTSVAQLSSPNDRDRNFGYFAFWVSIGHLIGPLLGGFLADQYSIRTAFFAAVGLSMLPGALAFTMPTSLRPMDERENGISRAWSSGAYRSAWQLTRRRDLQFLLIVGFGILFSWSIKTSFYPLYLESVGLSKSSIGLIFSLFGAAQMVVRPAIGLTTRRFGRERPLIGMMSLAAVAMMATPFLHSLGTLAIAAAMTGLALGFTQPVTMSMMAGNVDAHLRGLALGLRMTVNRLAELVSPILFGALVGLSGLGSAFFLSALGFGLGILVTVRGGLGGAEAELRRIERPLAERPLAEPPSVERPERERPGIERQTTEQSGAGGTWPIAAPAVESRTGTGFPALPSEPAVALPAPASPLTPDHGSRPDPPR
jgi:MFS family permease